jgi:hypothetical protein
MRLEEHELIVLLDMIDGHKCRDVNGAAMKANLMSKVIHELRQIEAKGLPEAEEKPKPGPKAVAK